MAASAKSPLITLKRLQRFLSRCLRVVTGIPPAKQASSIRSCTSGGTPFAHFPEAKQQECPRHHLQQVQLVQGASSSFPCKSVESAIASRAALESIRPSLNIFRSDPFHSFSCDVCVHPCLPRISATFLKSCSNRQATPQLLPPFPWNMLYPRSV